jgi:alpha-1,6-mannosyltransferase
LLALGALSGAIYLFVFVLPFPLARYYDTIPPVDYAKLTGQALWPGIVYAVSLTLLFAFYGAALYLAWDANGRWVVLGGAALFSLGLATIYPVFAIDLFIYALRSRILVLHGANPFLFPPQAFPADPWMPLAGEWAGLTSPYGPLWEGLAALPAWLAGDNFLAHLWGLKALGLASYWFVLGLVYLLAGRVSPRRRWWAVLACAWNPLLLLEIAGNGHNDLWLAVFVLPAFYSMLAGRRRMAFLALAASVLVKFTSALLLPLFLLFAARQESSRRGQVLAVLEGLALVIVVVVLAFAPVWPGWEHFGVQKMSDAATRSPMALAVLLLRAAGVGSALSFQLARYCALALLGLACLWVLYKVRCTYPGAPPEAEGLLWAGFMTLFFFLIIAAQHFHAWYLAWLVPLAALSRREMVACVVFCWSALVIMPIYEVVRPRYMSLLGAYLIGVPLAFGLPLLAWAWAERRARQSVTHL